MEAAAKPLPREESTPPVMKMNFVLIFYTQTGQAGKAKNLSTNFTNKQTKGIFIFRVN